MKQLNSILMFGGILIVILLISLVAINYLPSKSVKVELGFNPPKGNSNANVTIVEFSDFQCPACGKAQPILNEILNEYGENVSFYYRNFPLPIHINSMIAAKAAEAANEQGKFWEYHDILFANQNKLDETNLQKYAEQIGLDMNKFNSDFKSKKIEESIIKDVKNAKDLKVQGTPTFFINGKMVLGADKAKLKQIIEEELSK